MAGAGAGTIDVVNALPESFVHSKPISTTKSILRKNLVEILPDSQHAYSPDDSSTIRFKISSHTDFLVGPESFIRMDIQRTNNAAANNVSSFDVGGCHALIRSIEVRAANSGMRIEFIDYYNRYFPQKSYLYQDPDNVIKQGYTYGDDMHDGTMINPHVSGGWTQLVKKVGGDTWALSAAGVITCVGDVLYGQVHIGDEIIFMDQASGDVVNGYATAVSATTITLVNAKTPLYAAHVDHQVFVKRNDIRTSSRILAVKTTNTLTTLEFQPFLSTLTHHLPLFVMRNGIEIIITLEHGARCIKSGFPIGHANNIAATYEVKNPRFMAMMVTPQREIVYEFVKQYKSPEGLLYPIPSVFVNRSNRDNSFTSDNLSMSVGRRSCRRVFTIIQDSNLSDGTSIACIGSNSLSLCHRDNITSYQYKISSEQYPRKAVTCDTYSTRALEQVKLVTNNYSGIWRFNPKDWATDNYVPLTATTLSGATERYFVLCADLSRDNGPNSALTGADLSISHLDLEINRSNSHASTFGTGTPIFYTFVEYDNFLRINEENMIILN